MSNFLYGPHTIAPTLPFNPLSQNPLIYIDGEDTASLPAVDPVENLFDLSANANHLQQTVINQKPALTTGGGFRGVLFDGVDDVMVRADALGLTGSPDITIFLVISYGSLDAGLENAFWLGLSGSGTRMALIKNNSSNGHKIGLGYGNGVVRFSLSFGTSRQLITVNRPASTNHNSSRVWKNGVEAGIVEVSSTNNLNLADTDTFLGAQDASGVNSITTGTVNSLAVYNQTFSDVDREELENFFIAKYGI